MNRLNAIIKKLKQYKPEKIILFGSSVRGEADEYSDLDIFIVKNTKLRFVRRLVEVGKLLGSKFGKIDVFVYTPKEFNEMRLNRNFFIEQILNEGKVIYEKK